jgi:hypothetical protein
MEEQRVRLAIFYVIPRATWQLMPSSFPAATLTPGLPDTSFTRRRFERHAKYELNFSIS